MVLASAWLVTPRLHVLAPVQVTPHVCPEHSIVPPWQAF
jgi:hypothetical protein